MIHRSVFMLLHCFRTKSQIVRQIERYVEMQVYQLGKEGFCNPFQVIHRSGEQSSPCGVSLAAALQIPIYQSVYTTKVPADITVGTFLFYEYSVKRQRDFFQFIPALPTASKSRCISLFKAAFSGDESSGSRATISFAACCVSSSVPLSFSISAIFISGRPC